LSAALTAPVSLNLLLYLLQLLKQVPELRMNRSSAKQCTSRREDRKRATKEYYFHDR
jgi:hypothetical protein